MISTYSEPTSSQQVMVKSVACTPPFSNRLWAHNHAYRCASCCWLVAALFWTVLMYVHGAAAICVCNIDAAAGPAIPPCCCYGLATPSAMDLSTGGASAAACMRRTCCCAAATFCCGQDPLLRTAKPVCANHNHELC